MSATVEITEEDGRYTAVDSETGVSGVGKSRALALAALALQLDDRDGDITAEDADTETTLRALGARVRHRFEEEGVTEEDVDDAIAWARSQ
ncbi:hypothetical protein [Halosimplex carlsbadense]|uniref:hypothetical protein n=1 Tax=Halosimplex carlsbadense TaxID=171164 RepID=UPI00067778DE|nr:hypothetical protein [Halosimplex carlsbadense]